MIEKLKALLEEHRKQALVCCDEKCFCWEVEAFIVKHEEDADTEIVSS